jgi:hypothetical protein
MTPGALTDDLREVVVRELAPLELPSVATASGVPSATTDGSPSRDRLARIAAMIRDAEQAMAMSSRRQPRAQDGRTIPLASRRNRRRLRADGTQPLVDIAS